MMRTLTLCVLSACAGAGAIAAMQPAAAAQNPARPVAYLSTQRVLAEWTQAKAEVARFQAAQQQKLSDVRRMQQALEATRRELAGATGEGDRASLAQRETEQRAALERAAAQAQAELQASQRQVQADLKARVRPVLQTLMPQMGVDVVIDGDSSVIWSKAGLDVTAEVIHALNSQPTAAPKP